MFSFKLIISSRNHYSAKPGAKAFQEPYAYDEYYKAHKVELSPRAKTMFQCVLPIIRYYIRLRYSLMQMLYDAMFENMVNGLPIARAMVRYRTSYFQPLMTN